MSHSHYNEPSYSDHDSVVYESDGINTTDSRALHDSFIENTVEQKLVTVDNWKKAKCAFYLALIFFLISNPKTYQFIHKLIGPVISISDNAGCPTTLGLFIATLIFFGVSYFVV
jgi:hypothetical protein